MKLEDLEEEEAKQAIKDWNNMSFELFAKKYHEEFILQTQNIIDKLKEKVKK